MTRSPSERRVRSTAFFSRRILPSVRVAPPTAATGGRVAGTAATAWERRPASGTATRPVSAGGANERARSTSSRLSRAVSPRAARRTPAEDAACGDVIEDAYTTRHGTAEECCAGTYGWMQAELCATRSKLIPAEKYWPDKIHGRCHQDTELAAQDPSVALFDSRGSRCASAIPWLSAAECVSASGGASGSDAIGRYQVPSRLSLILAYLPSQFFFIICIFKWIYF